jgi:membrane fusion protein (multidrug efflux system)
MKRFTALLVAGTLLGAFGCEDDAVQSQLGALGAPPKVITAEVRYEQLVDDIEALGTVKANESVEIRPRIASLVERIAFEEGDLVEQGELLVELERSEILAGLALAEANLSESRSIYNRNKSLASTQAISVSNLEQLLAQVQIDEAQVEAARARLANTRIRAPFTGRVGLRRVSPGSLVNTSTVITTLDDISRVKLDFSVPETFLTVVREGMAIVAHSIVYPNRDFSGFVDSVDTRLDPVSRAIQVRAIIDNSDNALKPGMFMTVDLQRDRGMSLVIPEQAIVPEGSAQYVFVVKDATVEKREVKIARRIPGFVVIGDGLAEGERVVSEGTGKVGEGMTVQEISDAPI